VGVQGKNAVIQKILAAAGLTSSERAAIDASQVPSHDELLGEEPQPGESAVINEVRARGWLAG